MRGRRARRPTPSLPGSLVLSAPPDRSSRAVAGLCSAAGVGPFLVVDVTPIPGTVIVPRATPPAVASARVAPAVAPPVIAATAVGGAADGSGGLGGREAVA